MGQPAHPLAAWRVLDTDFEFGLSFFETWLGWQQDPMRPRMLHYVALCERPCSDTDLLMAARVNPRLTALVQVLRPSWHGLLPGFHRFLLDGGQVILTLCVGEPVALLRAQRFEADTLLLTEKALEPAPLIWFLKALVRCCRRGTQLCIRTATVQPVSNLHAALQQCGFRQSSDSVYWPNLGPNRAYGRYDPPWSVNNTRHIGDLTALPVARCAVIGAGLAGASVAAALARRGWQVRVLDRAGAPGAGASGLPVGLVAPHVSGDDCTLSRLSRVGVRLMLQQAQALLQLNQDWAPSGVLERQVGGTPKLPAAWPLAGRYWSEPFSAIDADTGHAPSLWHNQGAWLKPAALVNAWLKQPGITFQGDALVSDLRQHQGIWTLFDDAGRQLCSAERVVFANACGAFSLLQKTQLLSHTERAPQPDLPKTQGMRGMLNWAMHQNADEEGFPAYPVNGSGSMVSKIPVAGGLAWFTGSTYQPEAQTERSDQDNQTRNHEHLSLLLPTLAAQLAPVFSGSTLNIWKGTRCVTADRLPAVGPLEHTAQPSLWLCAGLGSRGMSFSVLCAELLAARFGAEPLPIEAKLARSLEALRA
jgi:tRNA 5-methylaminomethyl-2-thiouridine biosynthesis bifunctional protein